MIRLGIERICRAAEGAGYALILPIFFERGAGVTRSVSSKQVSFVTEVPLAPGEHLTGSLRLPPINEEVGSVLRYEAQVVSVQRPQSSEGLLHVTALFEMLTFVAERMV